MKTYDQIKAQLVKTSGVQCVSNLKTKNFIGFIKSFRSNIGYGTYNAKYSFVTGPINQIITHDRNPFLLEALSIRTIIHEYCHQMVAESRLTNVIGGRYGFYRGQHYSRRVEEMIVDLASYMCVRDLFGEESKEAAVVRTSVLDYIDFHLNELGSDINSSRIEKCMKFVEEKALYIHNKMMELRFNIK